MILNFHQLRMQRLLLSWLDGGNIDPKLKKITSMQKTKQTQTPTELIKHKDHDIRANIPKGDIENGCADTWKPLCAEASQWEVTKTRPKWVVVSRDIGTEMKMGLRTRDSQAREEIIVEES